MKILISENQYTMLNELHDNVESIVERIVDQINRIGTTNEKDIKDIEEQIKQILLYGGFKFFDSGIKGAGKWYKWINFSGDKIYITRMTGFQDTNITFKAKSY